MATKRAKKQPTVPEAEKQSTLVLAHLGALEPVLDQLPAAMGLELKEALEKFQKALDKALRTKIKRMSCFQCDGTGQMCDICGESETACSCDEMERTFSACEDCKGVGQVEVPLEGC